MDLAAGPEAAQLGIAAESGYELHVARSDVELEPLRPDWERLNRDPNAEPEFFRLINSIRDSVVRPHVIALRKRGLLTGLVVARLVRTQFQCSIGYKTLRVGTVRQIEVLHGGLVGDCGGHCATLIVDELIAALGRNEADVVFLSYPDTASDVFRAALERPRRHYRDRVIQAQPHWRTRLPASLDGFLGRLSQKHRYWIRRMGRLLEAEFPGRIEHRRFSDYADIDSLASDLEAVAEKTYQRGLGDGFTKIREQVARLEFCRRQGWSVGRVICIDGRPCAFWMGTVYRNVFHSEATGYDPAYRKNELGTIVFMKLIEDLCQARVEAIDFGLGDALYKQRFGEERWDEACVRIFAPSWRGLRFSLLRTFVERPALAARRLAERLGIDQRLRTLWRRRLAGARRAESDAREGDSRDA